MVAEAQLEDPALDLRRLAERMNKDLIVVADTLRGLQDAARIYLEQFPGLLRIGITGSSGKTTTKEIAAAMIGCEKPVLMNPGNLNSETGLPLAVFGVRPGHEVGVFELGMNRRGEIRELAELLKPQLALVTCVGTAHIGILGSRGAIAEEKKNIFSQFSGAETALIPDDDEYSPYLAEGTRGRVRYYGSKSLEELGTLRDLGLAGTEIDWAGEKVRFALPGRHNLKNALAAAAIAREVPVSPEAVRKGLESAKALFGRSEILEGRTTLVRDCYNSNPESAAAALDFCDSLDWRGRRVYVMGSMLELGAASQKAHEELGKALAASRADMVFLFGEETAAAAGVLKSSGPKGFPFFYTGRMDELSRSLEEYIRPGDLVLLKGSRDCALEGLTDMLLGRGGE
jgi:UDP-N-acetylmuramoyl-tripeptide--D-alanyl-D-alanine ligase